MIWSDNTVRFMNKGGADQNNKAQQAFYSQMAAQQQQMFGAYQQLGNQILGQLVPLAQQAQASYTGQMGQLQSAIAPIMGNIPNLVNSENSLDSTLSGIANKGPSQQGFSPQELQTLQNAATNTNAQQYANASAALKNQLGSEGGGDTYLPNGSNAQLEGELVASAAGANSGNQNTINLQNWQQGNQNWQNATTGLNSLFNVMNGTTGLGLNTGSGILSSLGSLFSTDLQGINSVLQGYNPTGYANATANAGQSANGAVNAQTQANSGLLNSLIGGVSGVAAASKYV